MSYIVSNKSSRVEYRVYTEYPEEPGLKLIYKGHKLGVDDSLLNEIINYKYEASTNRYYYIKYDVWYSKYNFETPLNTMVDIWDRGNLDSKNLYDSWLNLLKTLKSLNGEFKNILIFKINI